MAASTALQELRKLCAEVEEETAGECDPVLAHMCRLGAERVVPPLSEQEAEEHCVEVKAARDCLRELVPADPQEYLRKYTPAPIFPAIVRRNMEIERKNPVCDRCFAHQKKALAPLEAAQRQQLEYQQQLLAQHEQQLQLQQQEEEAQQQLQSLLRQKEAAAAAASGTTTTSTSSVAVPAALPPRRKTKGRAPRRKGRHHASAPAAAAAQAQAQPPVPVPAPRADRGPAAADVFRQHAQHAQQAQQAQQAEFEAAAARVRAAHPLHEAVWFCPDCVRFLCGACDAAKHARGTAAAAHHRLTMGQFLEAYDSRTYGIGHCREHPRQPVQVYCATCKRL